VSKTLIRGDAEWIRCDVYMGARSILVAKDMAIGYAYGLDGGIFVWEVNDVSGTDSTLYGATQSVEGQLAASETHGFHWDDDTERKYPDGENKDLRY